MNPTLQQIYPPSPVNFTSLWSFIKNILLGIFSVSFLQFLYVLMTLLTIAMITLILYLLVRMYEIRQEQEAEKRKQRVAVPVALSSAAQNDAPVINQVWKHIREELLSDNASDWKLAIIEADIYMDRILDDKGFHGDTTSDKLKQVTADKLPSISIAWEVHKVRNSIAHQGAAFVVTMPEARRLLSFYEMIFTDLGVIVAGS